MIAACPTCDARYRIDVAKLRPEGARLRCARCESVFRVQAPGAPAAGVPTVAASPAPAKPVAAPPVTEQSSAAAAPTAGSDSAEPRDRDRLVLIATPESEEGKQIASALTSWGFEPILVHDGVEAILNVQRSLPRVVILDAALPKMFGFQVCELMKRNESLREIKVVLVGAIHDESRYRRPPQEMYGADTYAERHELLGVLESMMANFARAAESGPVAASAPAAASVSDASATASPPQPAAAPAAPVAAAPVAAPIGPGGASAQSPEREQAERLARIIVSDIILYNQEKFDAGVLAGNVSEALASELAEGTALLSGRIAPGLGNAQDFLSQELLRIARSKGMN